jgi:hypothetical protein
LKRFFIVVLLERVFNDNCVISFTNFARSLALAFPSSGTSTS